MNKDWILKHSNRICENITCNKKYSEHQNGKACGDFVTSGKRICIYGSNNTVYCFSNCIERECPSCGTTTTMYAQVNDDGYTNLQIRHKESRAGYFDVKCTVHICDGCGLVSHYKIDPILEEFVRTEGKHNVFAT